MAITEIVLEEPLWATASQLRRDDWRVSIADLLSDTTLGGDGDHLLRIGADDEAVTCTVLDARGVERRRFRLVASDLRPHVKEYLRVMRKLRDADASHYSAHMTAFDMAKKVVHDAAAATLARALPDLAPDHESYRRLFSLFFSVVVDVTRVPGATAHRRHT